MQNLSFTDKMKVIGAYVLIKSRFRSFEDFTKHELNEYLSDTLPYSINVNVPVGQAKLVITNAAITFDVIKNKLNIELQNEFTVTVLATPVYRSHVQAIISFTPKYQPAEGCIYPIDIGLDALTYIDDDYSFVSDPDQWHNKLSPVSVFDAFVNPVKQLVNEATAGLSDSALHYLRAFTQNNKQKLLDEHKPTIEKALLKELNQQNFIYTLNTKHWREWLFSRLGTHITVEKDALRFWLS
jgi:hypothetical protein